MANKRKKTTAIVAGVTAAALLLGGTFAWTSISQQALNETAGVVNVGGRLHDDFDGTNKDVYVENFTDPLNGGQPIYARIKLTEYMEVGQDAGGTDDGDGNPEAVPVVENTDINDVDSWTPHVPSDSCAVCATEGTCKIHDHWEWIMGGDNGTTGQTTFMPTFNKDKDSLAADINGTYHGIDDTDKVYYDDYVEYTTDTTGLAEVAQAEIAAQDGKIYSVIGEAYYDDDADHDTNDHEQNIGGFKTETETHTAKQTATATVITMQAWIDGGKNPGNYWVYDTDGWAYWANPIMPGEATGLLLDSIEMTKNPGEKCYYAINVVAEFATVGDWEYFTGINETDNANALELLAIASANVTTVTVVNNGDTTLSSVVDEEAGITNTTTFNATAAKASDTAVTYADAAFTWAVYDTKLNPVDTSAITVDENGTATLTVGADETNANLIIVAKHTASGAVGLSAVAIDNPVVTYRLAVSSNDTVEDEYATPYEDRGAVALDSGYTVTLMKNDKPLTISEVVGVEIVANYNEYYDELNVFAGSADLQDDGTVLLTVGTQDVEFGTGSTAGYSWKIIKLTVKDGEGTEYSRNLLISNDTWLSYSDMIYRHMDGSLATNIQQYYVVNDLVIDTMYTFEPSLHSQSHGTMSRYLDPVPFDDGWTVTAYVEDDEGNQTEATSVTIKGNTIIFAETGSYVIMAEKEGEEAVRSNVTVDYPTLTVVATDPDWDGSFAEGESMTFKVEGDYTADDLLWEDIQDGGAAVNITLTSNDDGTATITHNSGICAESYGSELIKVSLVDDPNVCGYVPITCE